jgi:glycosyltransferase involved in cell wall biosynthesis
MRMSGVSGSENHLRQLLPLLPPRGWRASLLIPAPATAEIGAYCRDLADAGVDVTTVPMRGDADPGLLRRLRRELRDGGHDVVHTHLVHADWHAGLAAMGISHPPLVSTKHNHDPFREGPLFRVTERLFARRYASTVAISHSLAAFADRTTGRQPEVIRYGLAPAERPAGGPRRRSLLLGVGRLEPQKGWDVALRAMPAVVREVPGAELRIAGTGSERARLEALIDELRIRDHVRLLGNRDDVPELMLEAETLVHPARWEGFGLVLLEAMRAGLPIVATSVGAIPEVVGDGAGLLVEPDRPAELASVLVDVLRDNDLRERLADRGDKVLRTRFSPGRMADEHAELYDRLIAPERPSAADEQPEHAPRRGDDTRQHLGVVAPQQSPGPDQQGDRRAGDQRGPDEVGDVRRRHGDDDRAA